MPSSGKAGLEPAEQQVRALRMLDHDGIFPLLALVLKGILPADTLGQAG